MKSEKFFVKSKNGSKLACLVAKPEGKAEGLVVSSQGFGSTTKSQTYQILLEELPKKGFIIVVFEYQGLGESEGKFEETCATRDLEDLRAVVDYAYNSFEFDKKKFLMVGSSFGGFTALNLVLEDDRIKGLVLRAPLSDFMGIYGDESKRERRKEIKDYESFLDDGNKYDIYQKASEINIPVRIIHGDKDDINPIEQSKKLQELLPNAELRIIEGEGHEFENKKKEVYDLIIKSFEGLK